MTRRFSGELSTEILLHRTHLLDVSAHHHLCITFADLQWLGVDQSANHSLPS